ncbi:MAG: hypothetical protein LBT12_03585 [Oscillospiraceae bacterium]|jgi:hypothetical protein|nr:hypothetical protein [Oscillospiraceae bacterium]
MHDGHTHDHAQGAPSLDEALAFLRYTLHHNGHHEEELHGLMHSLERLGKAEAAAELQNCIEDQRCGSEHLENALKLLEG